MLQYEVVTLPAKRVVGLKARTGNTDPACPQTIGGLWEQFMRTEAWQAALQRGPDAVCYGLYTNYGLDDESYEAVVACESASCPEGFTVVEIPAGEYAKFHFHGDVRKIPMQAWSEIWSLPLPRAYGVDFEEYRNAADGCADIDIYVGLAEICQSCGMPMARPTDFGTEADGAASHTYCTYCYQNGAFTYDATMEEQIEHNLNCAPELYSDRERARAMMREYFPTLQRWKGADPE